MKNIIAGNWKMNNLKKDIDSFINKFEIYQKSIDFSDKEVFIAPVSVYFYYFFNKIKNKNLNIKLGLQNCHYESKGAFTGEISPEMVKDINADFVIIGHSERRHIFNESDEIINKKVTSCLEKNIRTILCIGEKLKQRETGNTFYVLEEQLSKNLDSINSFENLIIAYEPVWAIGTGKTASPEQIAEVHNWLQKYLEKNIANNVPLLYGGSVKSSNIKNIMSIDNVNGVLVGGASLNIEDFIQIINFDKE